jgi:uncharacterized protein YqhQ
MKTFHLDTRADLRCGRLFLGIVTIVFLWITIACVMWHESIIKDMFTLPIAALFAFTSIRQNLPGAPAGFGE